VGWRAIRVGLDKTGVDAEQLQAVDVRPQTTPAVGECFPLSRSSEEYARRAENGQDACPEGPLGHVLPSRSSGGDAGNSVACLWPRPSSLKEESSFLVDRYGKTISSSFFFAATAENELVAPPLLDTLKRQAS